MDYIVPSPFHGRVFCHIKKHNMAFVVVAKNCSSFLKNLAIHSGNKPSFRKISKIAVGNYLYYKSVGLGSLLSLSDTARDIVDSMSKLRNKQELPRDIIYSLISSEKSDYFIPLSDMQSYEDKNGKVMKFAVWRDPVERFISSYKYFCLERNFFNYYRSIGLYDDNSLENFLKYVEFELTKSNPLFIDVHVRRKVDYYSVADVDYIVPANKLNKFLMENGVELNSNKFNETSVNFELPSKEVEDRIKGLYQNDYKIKINYGS